MLSTLPCPASVFRSCSLARMYDVRVIFKHFRPLPWISASKCEVKMWIRVAFPFAVVILFLKKTFYICAIKKGHLATRNIFLMLALLRCITLLARHPFTSKASLYLVLDFVVMRMLKLICSIFCCTGTNVMFQC